jgi:hypothetical protein
MRTRSSNVFFSINFMSAGFSKKIKKSSKINQMGMADAMGMG